jgi:hypothetical protein
MKTATTRTAFSLVAAATTALLVAHDARSSDHHDAPATKGDPAADIGDLYTWTDKDKGQVIMAMTVFPFAAAGAAFSDATQYVFHTSSGSAFGKTTSDIDVICTFTTPQSIQCWVGTDDYVTGDPSDASKPLVSRSGKLTVFAGMRGDPFFFNLSGFVDTVTIVKGAASSLSFDPTGCPKLDAATSKALVDTLGEVPSKANPSRTNPDDFATANVLALVVSVDKSLVTKGGNVVAVWASTNKAK